MGDNTNRFNGFFRVDKKFLIGTPSYISKSERTFDISSKDFLVNFSLQGKLGVPEDLIVKAKRDQYTSKENDLLILYWSMFGEPSDNQRKREYLENNETLRILIQDEKLLEEIRQILN